jgi:hypothetical protein
MRVIARFDIRASTDFPRTILSQMQNHEMIQETHAVIWDITAPLGWIAGE